MQGFFFLVMVEETSIIMPGAPNSCDWVASCSLSHLFPGPAPCWVLGSTKLNETVLPEKIVDTVGSDSRHELQ